MYVLVVALGACVIVTAAVLLLRAIARKQDAANEGAER